MQNFSMSMLWFWIAYVCVTVIGILHTVFNIYVLHMKPMDSKGMGEALLSGLLRAGICIGFDVYCAVRQKTRNIAMNSQRIE